MKSMNGKRQELQATGKEGSLHTSDANLIRFGELNMSVFITQILDKRLR
jgi:hypothetical protein